jgi:hypothetical protein
MYPQLRNKALGKRQGEELRPVIRSGFPIGQLFLRRSFCA